MLHAAFSASNKDAFKYVCCSVISESFCCVSDVHHNTNLSVFLSVWSQGVGRRYAHVVLRKADIDLNKRAGELTDEEVRRARCLQTHTQSRWLQDSV